MAPLKPARLVLWCGPLIAGALGLWCTLGLLDVVDGPAGAVRIAMLPPWWLLGVFELVAVATGFMAARTRRSLDAALPLYALILLAVPYLPWLPDRLPLLQSFAGPARYLLWIVVGWSTITLALRDGRVRMRWAASPVVIFIAGVVTFGATAARLTTSSNYPDGDEPHYLVMTQSLLRDGDLKIENNHQRGDYHEYFSGTLRPDYLTRGVDGQIYSVHPVGLPVLSMPAYALAGYRGVVAMLVIIAALAAALLWQGARDATGSTAAATFAWAAAALTAPYLFNSFTVFPEIPGALAVMIALAWRAESLAMPVMLLRGVAIAALPWLSTKYAPVAAVIGVIVLLRTRGSRRAISALVAPVVVSLAGWFAFFWHFWGTLSPSAPYGSQEPMRLGFLARGGPGLFLDQEYGLLAYAPVLALAALGLARMLRAGGVQARRALEVMAVVLALLGTVGAFHVWWGGSGSPGRPMASVVLLLGVPIASLFATMRSTETRRSDGVLYHVLLAASLAVACAAVFAENGTLIRNSRDGSSALLAWMSPAFPLWSAAPSFIAGSIGAAAARALAWLALAAGVAVLARRARSLGTVAAAALWLALGGGVLLASALGHALPATGANAPDARSRLPLLDRFDARWRPTAVLYEPFSWISLPDALSRINLIARPGLRTLPQPVPLLWNARFALPAGEYRVRITRTDPAAPPTAVSLQIGRAGSPLEIWDVVGPDVEHTLVLPIDAAFVGFRAPASLDQSDGTLEVTPLRVVDEGRRLARPPVISAARFGAVTAFFHDDLTAVDAGGYWTAGRRTTQVTYAGSAASVSAVVHCGPVANHVTLSAPGWDEQFDVVPGASHSVTIPMRASEVGTRIAPIDIDVRNGFVPAEVDHRSSDRRLLGCRVELAGSK